MGTLKCLILLLVVCIVGINGKDNQPNIVIIMADDLGFDDASFRGSNEFLTPNIDALAYSGVILNDLYTPAMCTPSRSALLTGKYPINTGMQHYVIANGEPWGLPLSETTIAEVLRNGGYYTALVGKWHLGMFKKAYTPLMRGFDQHIGYLGSHIDYYNQTLKSGNYTPGHDFRIDLETTHDFTGTYTTDLLTQAAINVIENVNDKPLFLLMNHLAPHAANTYDPLQAPQEEIDKYSYIENETRRVYAAMVSVLDKSVGEVVNALSNKGILNNTIIMFLSDNGGPTLGLHSTLASNYPLRGQKNSPWEGGIRCSAAIWSTELEKLGTVWNQRIYLADVLPTLAEAAGIQLNSSLNLDGLNLWSALKYGYESVEREMVHNIDDLIPYVSYTKGKWKYINGTTSDGEYDSWIGERNSNSSKWDPRALNYEEVIRNTSVWQALSKLNAAAAQINITENRMKTETICLYDTSEGIACNPLEEPCLFDLDVDPCEQNNLYQQMENSTILLEMLERIETFRLNAHEPNNQATDPDCDPIYYNNEWTWWQDEDRNNGAVMYSHFSILTTFAVAFVLVFSNR